jgi:MarR family transcriptional regulator, transcriptional regulator for hemolysin
MRKFDPETFGPLLGGTARAWRLKLDERLRPMGLSQARWRTLLHLSRAREPLTQSQIAQNLAIEEPTLVTSLHRLEKEGWVIRKSSARDRRCKTVHLQPKAKKVIDRINATALRLRHELIREIPAREMQVCMRVLAQVHEQIDRAPGQNGSKVTKGRRK